MDGGAGGDFRVFWEDLRNRRTEATGRLLLDFYPSTAIRIAERCGIETSDAAEFAFRAVEALLNGFDRNPNFGCDSEGRLKRWLFTVAYHEYLNARKRSSRAFPVGDSPVESSGSEETGEGPEADAVFLAWVAKLALSLGTRKEPGAITAELVRVAIANEDHRRVFELRYFECLTYQQIIEVMGERFSYDMVRKICSDGRKKVDACARRLVEENP